MQLSVSLLLPPATLRVARRGEAGPSNYSLAMSAAAKELFHRRSRRHCLSVVRSSRIGAWSEEVQSLHRELSVRGNDGGSFRRLRHDRAGTLRLTRRI